MDGFDPFDFEDYRALLSAWLEYHAGRPSLRGLARRIGCSPSWLSTIISGSRNLDAKRAPDFAAALGLDADASQWFLALVELATAEDDRERTRVRARMLALRGYQAGTRVVGRTANLFSRWYLPVVCELVSTEGFRADPAWIASRLSPPITEHEAADAVRWLVDAGLLVEEGGTLKPRRALLATDHEIVQPQVSRALRQNAAWLLRRGAAALDDQVDPARLHCTTTILRVPDERLAEVKRRLADFQLEMIALCEGAEAPPGQEICALALLLLPLTGC